MTTPRPLGARLLAEALGTGFLVAAVVGSGIQAERLSPGDVGLQLLENSTATALALVALISCFGPISGAHLNPAVTLTERLTAKIDTPTAAAYIATQTLGGCAGTLAANLMFDLPAIELSAHDRATAAMLLAEVVATFGLVTVIFGVVHSGRPSVIPVAVAGYIGAAYWFTSSTSFANPAVTIARTLSDSFAGIAPASAPRFVLAQIAGALLAVACGRVLFPQSPPQPEPTPVPELRANGERDPSLEEALDARS
jgi:glycerol uptake facilitator-like aquaporin